MPYLTLFSIFNINLNKKKFSFYKLYFSVLIVFTLLYWFFGTDEHINFDKQLNDNSNHITFLNALYFSVITQTTTGFGDIAPKSKLMRFLTICQLTILVLYFII